METAAPLLVDCTDVQILKDFDMYYLSSGFNIIIIIIITISKYVHTVTGRYRPYPDPTLSRNKKKITRPALLLTIPLAYQTLPHLSDFPPIQFAKKAQYLPHM